MSGQRYCRQDLLFLATTCEKAGRYHDMRDYVKEFVAEGFDLSPMERHLFSIAYKNILGGLRASWRSLKSIENAFGATDNRLERFTQILSVIEAEIYEIATEVLDQLCNCILPTCTGYEAKVYYLKLQGDYQRYMTEISSGKKHDDWASEAHASYKKAADIALVRLPPISSTRLGVLMNFSVFYYDVYHSPERACLLSKTAYDDAIEGGLFQPRRVAEDGDEYNNSLEILKLLKGNLQFWTRQLPSITQLSVPQNHKSDYNRNKQ